MTLPLEKDFQADVLKKLRKLPHSWWTPIRDRVTVGLPDIIGSCGGIFVALELKTLSKLAPIQAYTLRKIDRTGAQTFVVTPENWDAVYVMLVKFASLRPQIPTL